MGIGRVAFPLGWVVGGRGQLILVSGEVLRGRGGGFVDDIDNVDIDKL